MREFIRLFLFGIAWFFVPLLLTALTVALFLAYLAEAVVFLAALVTGGLYLITGDPGMREPFFYFSLTAIIGFAFSVAVLGKAWQFLSATRARMASHRNRNLSLEVTP